MDLLLQVRLREQQVQRPAAQHHLRAAAWHHTSVHVHVACNSATPITVERLQQPSVLCLVPPARRLLQNPAYYELEDATPEGVSAYLSQLVETALADLADAGCVTVRAAHHCVAALAPCAGAMQASQLLCSWVDATHTLGSCSLQS
jgi:hypothetical protein